ncbi:hypothetical protein JCM16303_004651 [Sporobolomyces ruberrimus]
MTPSESCLVDNKPPSVAASIRMPPELRIKVLQSLNYAELKRVARISKTFQAYTLGKAFDAVLFRRVMPSKPGPWDTQVAVHPMLRFPFCGDTGDKVYSAKDHPSIMKEYATSPASTQVVLHLITEGKKRACEFASPVTVGDVIQASADFWDELRVEDRAQVENGSVLAGWFATYSWKRGGASMYCEGLVPRQPGSFA